MRKIIHLDMDCFYAAIEMRARPELAHRPIAVGGGTLRGIVTTCNYEARKFGIRSAMPGFMARERCPHLIFLPLRFDLYRAVSQQIQNIFYQYTDLVEPLSLDEAFLDVSNSGRYAWDIAKEIRAQIYKETGLTASAGIAPNKMLAKIASDWRKPNGQFAILPDQIETFMVNLPVTKLRGIGLKTANRLAAQGVQTCRDLQQLPLSQLARDFGKWGEELFYLCRGHDRREVSPFRLPKSLSNESTFEQHLLTLEQCETALKMLCAELLQEVKHKAGDRKIRKAYVTVRFSDFSRTTKERICSQPSESVYRTLLEEAWHRKPLPVRLLGAGVRFSEPQETLQLELFSPPVFKASAI